jgi:hypothetical protein
MVLRFKTAHSLLRQNSSIRLVVLDKKDSQRAEQISKGEQGEDVEEA